MTTTRKMFRCTRCRSEMASNGTWINLVNSTCNHELQLINPGPPQSESQNTTGPLIPTMSEAFHFDRIKLALKKTTDYISDYNTKRNKLRQDFINQKKFMQQQFDEIKRKCDERQKELQKKLEEKYNERNQALQNQINDLTKYRNNCVDTESKMRKSLYDRKTNESDRQKTNSKMATDLVDNCPLAFEYALLLEFDPVNRNNLDFDIDNYGTITSFELSTKKKYNDYGPEDIVKEVSNVVNDPNAPKQINKNNFDNEEKQNLSLSQPMFSPKTNHVRQSRTPEPGSQETEGRNPRNVQNGGGQIKQNMSYPNVNTVNRVQQNINRPKSQPKLSPSPTVSQSLSAKVTFKVQHVKENYKRRVVLKNITENDFPQILQKIRTKATGDDDEFKDINYKFIVTTKNNKQLTNVHDLIDLTKEDIIHAIPE